MRSRKFALLVVAGAMCLAAPVRAQGPSFAGVAVDSATGVALPFIRVSLERGDERTIVSVRADARGTFVLVPPAAGTYRVRFDVPGMESVYGPADSVAGDTTVERAYVVRLVPMPHDKVHTMYQVEELPHPITTDPPNVLLGTRYPPAIEGDAEIEYVVDAAGTVRPESWRVIRSTSGDVANALRELTLKQRWVPAKVQGEPVAVRVRTTVRIGRGP